MSKRPTCPGSAAPIENSPPRDPHHAVRDWSDRLVLIDDRGQKRRTVGHTRDARFLRIISNI